MLNNALSLLGFEPKYMDIFLSENEILSDIDYEVTSMLSLLDKGATGILIKNKLYDETDCNYWFRVSIDKAYYNKVSLQWLNSDLDFLISSNSFQNFLKFKNIICGYCYDQEDCFFPVASASLAWPGYLGRRARRCPGLYRDHPVRYHQV